MGTGAGATGDAATAGVVVSNVGVSIGGVVATGNVPLGAELDGRVPRGTIIGRGVGERKTGKGVVALGESVSTTSIGACPGVAATVGKFEVAEGSITTGPGEAALGIVKGGSVASATGAMVTFTIGPSWDGEFVPSRPTRGASVGSEPLVGARVGP